MTTAKKKAKKKPASSKKKIRVRMYNVGFGDCFLIRLPTTGGERRMLVDCGFHSQGKGDFTDQELVKQIAADLKGERLDVVVATHRHQDHVSGFGETDLWKSIPVEEVWLPFTASPDAADAPAFAGWERLLKTASSLVDAGGKLVRGAEAALGARTQTERDAVAFMLWNARENAPGIANLRTGMKRADGSSSQRRYLPSDGKDVPFEFQTPALPGVVIHVLGPARDSAFRKKREPPAEWGLSSGSNAGVGDDASPFGPEWRIPEKSLPKRRPFRADSLQTIRLFNDDLLGAAAAVDGFLNGESLVLVLEVGKARLLLTGDAEVSAWMKILGDPKATALAAGATFLKCGHHGSHNATPLVFLREQLRPQTPVMMSTQEGPGTYRNNIPLKAIVDTMSARKLLLARSDRSADLASKPGPFAPGKDGHWIDCEIPA